MQNPKKRYLVVAAGVLTMLCLGVAYAWGVFIRPIEKELGWSRAEISLAVSILLLVFSGFMLVGGILEKKFGSRATVSLGGVLMAAAWIGSSFAHSPLWLYAFYGLLGGMATGLCYMAAVVCGIKWFPHKKGLITGIIIFGFGFGSAILSPGMTQLIKFFGWRQAMLYGGIGFGGLIVLSAQFLKSPSHIVTTGAAQQEVTENSFNYLEMLKTSSFWLLFLTYFAAMIAGMMTIGHVVAFATDRGLTAMQGAFALTVLAIFNGLGRILAGYLSDIWGGKKILISLFVIIGFGMFIFSLAASPFMFYGIAALIGICFGGFLAVYPPLTANYFGSKNFSINYGLMFIGYGSGCFLGPVIGGIVHDIMKSYHVAFYASGILAILGAVVVLIFLRKPKTAVN
jgi:OFA family oxalate/formate antiporter-like MFS transporter